MEVPSRCTDLCPHAGRSSFLWSPFWKKEDFYVTLTIAPLDFKSFSSLKKERVKIWNKSQWNMILEEELLRSQLLKQNRRNSKKTNWYIFQYLVWCDIIIQRTSLAVEDHRVVIYIVSPSIDRRHFVSNVAGIKPSIYSIVEFST